MIRVPLFAIFFSFSKKKEYALCMYD